MENRSLKHTMNKQLTTFTFAALLLAPLATLHAVNPLNSGIGPTFTDPHGVVFDDRVYLFTTDDFSPGNKGFVMKDWRVWSSSDLVAWKLESTLKPEDTFIGKPFNDCWATFGVRKNGKYYWYFSAGPTEIGVAMADSPSGPWKDPLGKPLVPLGLTPTDQRDCDILMDDDGAAYMVYGTFNYFIVRLGDDMVSLAEKPRPVVIENPVGPYGKGKTDDKPSLHKRHGIYYLSWSSFYAMSTNVYGPYTCKGSVITPERVAPEFRKGNVYYDRHGNFFTFNNQWYYACNDCSQPGRTPHYRDSIMAYVHYKDNGEMAPVRIDRIGVGQYDASQARIEAEDYFKSVKAETRECHACGEPVEPASGEPVESAGGFEMRGLAQGSELYYPNVLNLPADSVMTLSVASASPDGGVVEVREGKPDGLLLGRARIPNTGGWDKFQSVACPLKNAPGKASLCLVFTGSKEEFCRLDWFAFAPQCPVGVNKKEAH